jgi:hypothetical protein
LVFMPVSAGIFIFSMLVGMYVYQITIDKH